MVCENLSSSILIGCRQHARRSSTRIKNSVLFCFHVFYLSNNTDSQDDEPLNLSTKQNSPSTTPTISAMNATNHRSIASIWSPASLCEKESSIGNASTDIDSPYDERPESRSNVMSPASQHHQESNSAASSKR